MGSFAGTSRLPLWIPDRDQYDSFHSIDFQSLFPKFSPYCACRPTASSLQSRAKVTGSLRLMHYGTDAWRRNDFVLCMRLHWQGGDVCELNVLFLLWRELCLSDDIDSLRSSVVVWESQEAALNWKTFPGHEWRFKRKEKACLILLLACFIQVIYFKGTFVVN